MKMATSASALKYKLLSFGILLVSTVALILFRMHVLDSGKGELACGLLTVAAGLLFCITALPVRNRFDTALPHGLPSVTFGASITGFLMLTFFCISVYLSRFAPPENLVTDANPTISFFMKVFALLAAVYFLMTAASMSLPQKRSLHLLLLMMPILFFIFRILNDFIDNSTMPLAESGGYHLLGMIFSMLFFVCEGKLLIGKGNISLFLITGRVSVLLNAMYSVPILLHISQGGTQSELLFALLNIALMIYTVTRMASLRPAKEPEQPLPEPNSEQEQEQEQAEA